MRKRILFLSTNNIWSGSEILWYETALRFVSMNHEVGVGVYFKHDKVSLLQSKLSYFIDFKKKKLSLLERISRRSRNLDLKQFKFIRALEVFKPELVIISQGNDFGSLMVMKSCQALGIKYLTVTQLVTEIHWHFLDGENFDTYRALYRSSLANYFVSFQNLKLHSFFIGEEMSNNEVIWNPAIIYKNDLPYPSNDETFKLAFVGRIECFHKGLDLLVEVISSDKWKSRPIEINLYGDGPHVKWIQFMADQRKLPFLKLKGHTQNISDVWGQNHIMILPSRMEGSSLALLEAIHCGRSAIVTDVGGAHEILEDNVTGFIANSISVEGIDECMERAWNKRNEWKSMGMGAQGNLKSKMPNDPVDFFKEKVLKILEN